MKSNCFDILPCLFCSPFLVAIFTPQINLVSKASSSVLMDEGFRFRLRRLPILQLGFFFSLAFVLMSLLLSRLSLGKASWVRRSSLLLLSNGFSTSMLQTPPCSILTAEPCGEGLGKLVIMTGNYERRVTCVDKKVPLELIRGSDRMVTIGASHGWVATLKDDGILRLQDDLNPAASDSDPKRIPLPPLVTLPHCQTQIITNVSMSSASPEDEDCVVAVKFLGPQLSFCRPAQSNSAWTNIRLQNPCFFSSRVMFSKKHDMFRIPGSGGHLIRSWDLNHTPKEFQELRFQNLPEMTKTKRELLESCLTSQYLVESPAGETFLVKLYKKTINRIAKLKPEALMVFKLDEKGHAVYTQDIGDLCIYLSKSEPFCVPASSFPGLRPNRIIIHDLGEMATAETGDQAHYPIFVQSGRFSAYDIPPQNIDK